VLDRIHVLEGRQLVLLNIDEVIRIIRNADEPKPALIERFALSDRQAEDILEIRLRQLARLEAIKIEQELKDKRTEQAKLEEILASPTALKRTVIREIEADAKAFGDERRTLIQEEARGGRGEGGRRAGHRGGQPQGLGARAEGPRDRPRHAGLQGRRRAVRHLCLPQRGHAAGLRQQRPRLQRGRRRLARRARRRRAHHDADRPGSRQQPSPTTGPVRPMQVLLLANTGGFGLLARGPTCTAATRAARASSRWSRPTSCCRRWWWRPPTARWPAWRWTAGCWPSAWTS
jgi:hypothetical protein